MKSFPQDLKLIFVKGNTDGQPQQGSTALGHDGTEVVWASSTMLSMRSQFFQSALTWPKQEEAGVVELKEDGQLCELRKVDGGWMLSSTEGMASSEAGSKRRRGEDGQRMDVENDGEGGHQATCEAVVIPVKESVQVYSDAADLEAAKRVIQLMHDLAVLPVRALPSGLVPLTGSEQIAGALIKMLRWADMWSSPECIEVCLNDLGELEWTDLQQDDVEQLAGLPETITSADAYTEVRDLCALWLLQTFEAVEHRRKAHLQTEPVANRPARKHVNEVQQDRLSQFHSLGLPSVKVFAGETKPNAYNAYFLASWVWANHMGQSHLLPSTVSLEALDVGMCLLSSDHINALLSAPSGVPPSLRLLCEKCMLQKFGDVQQVVVNPDLRASFCQLSFAAVKRWAASDDLVCTFGEHDVLFAVGWWHIGQLDPPPAPTFELASVVRLSKLSRSLRHALPFFYWWPKPDFTAAFNAVYESSTAPAAPQSDAADPSFPSAWTSPIARRSVPPATADARAEATVVFTHQQLSSALSTEQRSGPFYARGSFWCLALELKEQGKLLWVSLAPSRQVAGTSAPPVVRAAFDISLQLPDGTLCPTQASSPPRWFLGGQSVGGPALGEAVQAGRPFRSVHDFRHLLSPHGEKSKKGLVFRCSISCVE